MGRARQNQGIVLLLVAATVYVSSARAAELKEVTGFGGEPGGARMFIYVPDQLAAAPPLLVAIHYCTGSAQAFFNGTTYRSQADKHGFIVVYPETTASDRCFDVHSEATLRHDGGGDSGAIAAMVRYTLREYSADASRVYVTGTSSGAMMTNVMVGAYPELFRAGAAFAGVPFGCFAGPDRWQGDCASGRVSKSGQAWGDLVRAAYPGYTGPRPRMQLWHGDQDETLSFNNFGEEIKQWTNVVGVSEQPGSSEPGAPQAGWTRTRYTDSAGVVRVEAMVGPGMSHNLTVLSDEAVVFFGLDAAEDPVPAANSGGSAGAGSATPGAAGATGARRTGTAGAPGTASSSTSGTAGAPGTANSSAANAPSTSGTAGAPGTANSSAANAPSTFGTAGAPGTANSSAANAPSTSGTAGAPSTRNSAAIGVSTASAAGNDTEAQGGSQAPESAANGCNTTQHTSSLSYTYLLLALFSLHRKRRPRADHAPN
jgi:acetylxylan esterase